VYTVSIIPAPDKKKIAQSNLGTGRIATPGDRPTHSHRVQSFSIQLYLPGGTNVHAHLVQNSLRPPNLLSKRQLDRCCHFCMADRYHLLPIRYIAPTHFPQNLPLVVGDLDPLYTVIWAYAIHHSKWHLGRVCRFFTINARYQRTDRRYSTAAHRPLTLYMRRGLIISILIPP